MKILSKYLSFFSVHLSLIGRRGGGYDGYGRNSRDYALDVPCAMATCAANCNGVCSMASAIVIGADGRCQTGLKNQRTIEDMLGCKPKGVKSKTGPKPVHEGD